jgi:hypothetical protein
LDTWEYFNKDKKDFGFLYQVACSLGKPFRILSFDGPFKGSAADVSIMRLTIVPQLLEGEKVMCDKGYWQEEHCWTPPIGSIQNLSRNEKIERRKVTRIRQLNERLIGRLKTWGVLKRRWSSSFDFHKLCAHVATKLTNLSL